MLDVPSADIAPEVLSGGPLSPQVTLHTDTELPGQGTGPQSLRLDASVRPTSASTFTSASTSASATTAATATATATGVPGVPGAPVTQGTYSGIGSMGDGRVLAAVWNALALLQLGRLGAFTARFVVAGPLVVAPALPQATSASGGAAESQRDESLG